VADIALSTSISMSRQVGWSTVDDEVDRLVAAWHAERPDLDVEPLQVLSRISRLARHLDRARRSVFSAHDLESWEFDVLTALRRAGEPYQLNPGQLLRATLVTSGTMTNRIDRLEAAGLVKRHPDPQDKRGIQVQLTETGKARVDAAFADLLERERLLLAGLSGTDRGHLADLLRTLLVPFDATGDAQPRAPRPVEPPPAGTRSSQPHPRRPQAT
jgi:DNA-binding MarR family transcriptional regulator